MLPDETSGLLFACLFGNTPSLTASNGLTAQQLAVFVDGDRG